MVTIVVRIEDVVDSFSALEEGPVVAEDRSVVCDEDIGTTSVKVEEVEEKPGVAEDIDVPQYGIPLLVAQN